MAANPFQYAVSQVQKKAQELLNPVGHALNRVPQQFGNYLKQSPQYQGAQVYGQAIGNMVAAAPFKAAQFSENYQKMGRTPITPQEYDAHWDKADKHGQKLFGKLPLGYAAINYQPVKDATPRPIPPMGMDIPGRYVQPTSDPGLEKLKQEVLANPNFRPEAREYLSKTPVSYAQMPANVMGMSNHRGTPSRGITMTDKMKDNPLISMTPRGRKNYEEYKAKQNKHVMEHELLHQTPRLLNNDLFHPDNQNVVDSYTRQWSNYSKQKNAGNLQKRLVEEMFAESNLPPAYYWHIYKNVVPKATPQGFMNTLKALTTPQYDKERISNTGTQGKISPIKGGEKVQYGR